MKTLSFSITLVILAGLVGYQIPGVISATEQGVEAKRDGVFIHITHSTDDPHRVLMGLKMAELMMETKDVVVYFDIKGIELLLKGGEDLKHAAFPSLKQQLMKMLEKGVPLLACPGCLKAAGKSSEDLMEGIRLADKETFFGFTKGRILTLDY